MKFNPAVFIVKDEYHITVVTESPSQVYVKIGRKYFYEDTSGILPVLDNVHKIKIKQSILDKAGEYKVILKKVIKKSTYWPKYEKEKVYSFKFKNDNFDNLKSCYLADVHNRYDIAKKLVANCGDIDLLICNGDLGESSSLEEILRLSNFLSDIGKGELPILFVRGNHDTRGEYAEVMPKYMGMDGYKGYFTFSFRSLGGIALDCGEDKIDNRAEYGGSKRKGGANRFELYRKEELAFIKKAKMPKCKYLFGVCHTSFMLRESMHDIFDIDEKTYKGWADAVNNKNIAFMLCGHTHKFQYSPASETADKRPHNYPVITGSAVKDGIVYGTAISFENGVATFNFIDPDNNVLETHEVKCF